MKRILYIECNMGVAGDMLMGALLDLTDNKDAFIKKMNSIGIPDVNISCKQDVKCGITGTHVSVTIDGAEEKSEDANENYEHMDVTPERHHHDHHSHEHNHEHHHNHSHKHNHEHHHNHSDHHHASMSHINSIIDKIDVSDKIKNDVRSIYEIIAEAESKVHGKSVSEIHFHEVGMMDALADIVGCSILIDEISPDKIIVSPIKTGFGQVKCAHGIMPVPAPATALILQGVPNSTGNIEGELCTPTGAAIVKYFADEFAYQSEMIIEKTGYGTGNKNFEAANCVRAIIGKEATSQQIVELACNLDDMSPEEIGYAVEKLRTNKTLDVFTTPVYMKKSRPGIMLSVLCNKNDRKDVAKEIFKYTTTIGIREYNCDRFTLERKVDCIETPLGTVRVKRSKGYGVQKEKLEYDDLSLIADENNISIHEVKKIIEEMN